MSVLSDGQIQEYMANDQLILGGDPERAKGCAYEFRAGLVVSTGSDNAEECQQDWTGSGTSKDVHGINPGEMVWIRAFEKVFLPDDICAFWAQTNRLSRQGLMLVNMSMVLPGHDGNIACLFVNFGKRTIQITPDMIVAKLVFMRLGAKANKPMKRQPSTLKYDRSIVTTAMNAPTSFLSLAELATGLHDEEHLAINAIRNEKELQLSHLREAKEEQLASLREAKEQQLISLREAKEEQLASLREAKEQQLISLSEAGVQASAEMRRDLSDDLGRFFRRALGPMAIGFLFIILASSFVPWIQSLIQPDLSSEIRRIVQESVSNQSGLTDLEERLRDTERQLQEIRQQSGSGPSGSSSTSTSRP